MPSTPLGPMAQVVRRSSRWIARRTSVSRVAIPRGRPILSVTFDDVIASACERGADILGEHGCRGTYYVAGGLTGTVEEGKRTHERAHLEKLHGDGHQLACHGWSHRASTDLSAGALAAELRRNAGFLAEITGTDAALDFAFPLGAYGHQAKRVCSEERRSCRTTSGGLHQDSADLMLLGSHRLYGPSAERAEWEGLLDGLAGERGGWAIVNTHAVEDDPGPYGSTPQLLDAVVRGAVERGIEVLPVGSAIERLQAAGSAS